MSGTVTANAGTGSFATNSTIVGPLSTAGNLKMDLEEVNGAAVTIPVTGTFF